MNREFIQMTLDMFNDLVNEPLWGFELVAKISGPGRSWQFENAPQRLLLTLLLTTASLTSVTLAQSVPPVAVKSIFEPALTGKTTVGLDDPSVYVVVKQLWEQHQRHGQIDGTFVLNEAIKVLARFGCTLADDSQAKDVLDALILHLIWKFERDLLRLQTPL